MKSTSRRFVGSHNSVKKWKWHLSLTLPLDKMAAISQTIFSSAFSLTKSLVFLLKLPRSFFQGSNLLQPCIDSDNGMAPDRRQAIIWTNAYPIHWRIYAALEGDELTLDVPVTYVYWIWTCRVVLGQQHAHIDNMARCMEGKQFIVNTLPVDCILP